MKTYTTSIVFITLRPDDVILLTNNEDWNGVETLEVVEEVTSTIRMVVDNQSRGILAEVANRYVPKELLKHYQAAEMGDVARALLLNSFGAKVIGNLFFKLFGGKPNGAGRIVPTKLFTEREAAEEWLLAEIAKHKAAK